MISGISALYCSFPTGWHNFFFLSGFVLILGFAFAQPDYRKAFREYFLFKNIFRLPEVKRSGGRFFALLMIIVLTLFFEKTSTYCWN